MSKPKFKVGDFVKLKKNVKPGDYIDGYTILPSMYECLQRPRQIKKIVYLSGQEIYVATVNGWFFPFNSLELATAPEKIIIYRNGADVVAKNTSTGKTGVAKCNPADEFDFNIGAKLAFERLTNPEPEKPKYYNGKVVCIESPWKEYTVGKIYTFENGKTKDNNGTPRPHGYRAKDINHYNTNSVFTFVPLIED